MSEKFKILSSYIKDMSSETPDVESFLYTKDNISKYELTIDINSKPLKNKLIEINTSLKFKDNKGSEKKTYFEKKTYLKYVFFLSRITIFRSIIVTFRLRIAILGPK